MGDENPKANKRIGIVFYAPEPVLERRVKEGRKKRSTNLYLSTQFRTAHMQWVLEKGRRFL